MEKIVVDTKLSEEDYINSNFYLLFKKPIIKISIGIGVILVASSLLAFDSSDVNTWIKIVFGLLMIFGLPLQVYMAGKRNYATNKVIGERIIYEFSEQGIELKGESFTTLLLWEKIHQITETKRWLLIWQSERGVNILAKNNFTGNKLSLVKDMVKSINGLTFKWL